MQNILQNQYVQYKQSRENIDVVNRKYHGVRVPPPGLEPVHDKEHPGVHRRQKEGGEQ